jgi:beta-glucanase (GH16 family)
MKKIFGTIIIILLGIFLLACSPDEIINTPTPIESTPTQEVIGEIPVFSGLDDWTYYIGDSFNPTQGVTAIDFEDGDISSQIYVLGLESLPLTNNVFTETGTYELTYIIIDSDFNWVTQIITLTIEEPIIIGDCDYERDGYVLTWCDDFSGEGENLNAQGVNLDKWGFQLGTGTDYGLVFWGNNEQQFYRSENARVTMGELIIEAKNEIFGGRPYTSARLYTKDLFSQKYGRFEAMIKLPVGEGLWPAFWLMPQDDVYGGWANSGEIDIMEARGRLPFEASSALHFGGQWPNNTYTTKKYIFEDGQSIAEANLYAVEWDETEFRFYVNDVLYHTVNQWHNTGHDYPAPFDQPFYIILNLAVGGGFDGNRVPPSSLFEEPVEMIISYVRVYQRIENEVS